MTVQVIKSEKQYLEAMAQLDELMVMDLEPGSDEGNTLEVLSVLIEKYEGETVDLGPIDPIEAIKFRLDQEGKSNRSLIPYIGSASKVSEVLSGKRKLSLNMIRALHNHLGLSYEALMSEHRPTVELDIEWTAFPLKEMLERQLCPGYLKIGDVKEYAQECVENFFGDRFPGIQMSAHHKSSARTGRPMNKYSLAVWHELSLKLAEEITPKGEFDLGELDDAFFDELASLSIFEKGPLLAEELLSRKGIRVVHVPHFSKTYLDGAALILEKDNQAPVISLTGRHDRLDNYWYVLLHELVHVRKHLFANGDSRNAIYDDLDAAPGEDIEEEADAIALNTLVSEEASHYLRTATDAREVSALANEYNRSPAIYAGFLRNGRGNYRIFNNLIGRKEVSAMFDKL